MAASGLGGLQVGDERLGLLLLLGEFGAGGLGVGGVGAGVLEAGLVVGVAGGSGRVGGAVAHALDLGELGRCLLGRHDLVLLLRLLGGVDQLLRGLGPADLDVGELLHGVTAGILGLGALRERRGGCQRGGRRDGDRECRGEGGLGRSLVVEHGGHFLLLHVLRLVLPAHLHLPKTHP